MTNSTSILIRIVGKAYGFPVAVHQFIEQKRKNRHCILSQDAKLHATCRINNRQPRNAIYIGRGTHVLCRFETYKHGGRIRIGDYCFVGENTYIWSASEISIGNRVLISHNVNIHDTDSHSLSADKRHQHFVDIFQNGTPDVLQDVETKPIVIEDDVWIGFGALIFKGVRVGKGAIVGAQSVVTKDIPHYTIVAGNPARHIGVSRP
jgi:acetyltransferase-like isoleucine patch superfamily enzyme